MKELYWNIIRRKPYDLDIYDKLIKLKIIPIGYATTIIDTRSKQLKTSHFELKFVNCDLIF